MRKLLLLPLVFVCFCLTDCQKMQSSVTPGSSQVGAPATKPTSFRVGVNLSGLEQGNVKPGVAGTDYQVPTTAELDYYKSQGMLKFRLPVLWERLQPTVGGSLDPTYLGYISTLLSQAATRGLTLILDLHNYATRPEGAIGSSAVPVTAFADVWTKFASAVKGTPGLGGYDLMNEPANISSASWQVAAQAAINAIRTVDSVTKIYVMGGGYGSAWSWVSTNPTLHQIVDPANNLIFEAHVYLDRDNSGTHFTWADEVLAGSSAPSGIPLDTNIGVARITGFIGWLNQHGFKGHLGELGAGRDEAGWLTALDNTLAVAQTNQLEVDIWAGGPGWGTTYPYAVEFGSDIPLQSQQMSVLTKYTGARQPLLFQLSGPSRVTAGTASSNFSVAYRGWITNPINLTLTDGGAGGTFTPSTLTLPAGFNALTTFTYTGAANQTVAIGGSSAGGLTPLAKIGVTTKSDLFASASQTATNIFALRRIYSPYIGNLVRLVRSSDNGQSDFGITAAGDLDVAAIAAWAGASTLHLVRWYDQSSNQNDIQPVYSDNNQGATTAADYPLFLVNGGDGKPLIRFSGSQRADFPCPLTRITGQTILNVVKHNSGERMLSAQFQNANNWPGDSMAGYWNISSASTDADNSSTHNENLSLGLITGAWHAYEDTWLANTSNGWKTYRDGANIATGTSAFVTWSLDYNRNTYNMGWDRFYGGSKWTGDVRELVLFSGALTNAEITAFDSNMRSYYSL